jgi:hypothetical protein
MSRGTSTQIDAYQEPPIVEYVEGVSRNAREEADKRFGLHKEAVKKAAAIDYCGKGSIIVAINSSQQITIVPIRCKSWRCPKCGPILGYYWAHRIEGAKPQRFITLTGDPKLHQTPALMYGAMKAALPKLVRRLREVGIKFEYAAVWELHESGFPHLHIMQKGGYVPWKLLKYLWVSLGIGTHVHLETVDDAKRAAFYVAKYISKAVASLHAGLKITKTVQISQHFFEKSLLKRPENGYRSEGVIRTRRHVAEVVTLLVSHYGFTLADVEGTSAFALSAPPKLSWEDTLRLLTEIL